jgi:hypothetical protein
VSSATSVAASPNGTRMGASTILRWAIMTLQIAS